MQRGRGTRALSEEASVHLEGRLAGRLKQDGNEKGQPGAFLSCPSGSLHLLPSAESSWKQEGQTTCLQELSLPSTEETRE